MRARVGCTSLGLGAHPFIARLRQHVVPPQQLPSRGAFWLSASLRGSTVNGRDISQQTIISGDGFVSGSGSSRPVSAARREARVFCPSRVCGVVETGFANGVRQKHKCECQLFWARRTPGGLEQVITYKERRVPRRRTRRKIVFFQLDYFRKIKAGCLEQSQARPENTLYAMAGGFESFDLYRLMAERSLAGCRYSLRIFALPHRSGETLGRGPRSQPRTPMATGQRRSRQFRRVEDFGSGLRV